MKNHPIILENEIKAMNIVNMGMNIVVVIF